MTRPIGYYAHHHGAGHRERARAIAAICGVPVVLLGTDLGQEPGTVDLPDDRLSPGSGFDGMDGVSQGGAALHYAPLDHEGIRARVARVTRWIAESRPSLMVVDVSVEIAMLARLASVPTVYVRLAGMRDDLAHLEAFRSARGLLAPFHPALDTPAMPDWVKAKTGYFPGITAKAAAPSTDGNGSVVAIFGAGGAGGNGNALADAARTTPHLRWRVIGPVSQPDAPPPNLELMGWVDEPHHEIARADVVIGAAGDGVVDTVLAADRPFICIPEDRPFGEQRQKAARLADIGAAIVPDAWPRRSEWAGLIARAGALHASGHPPLHAADGAATAAAWLEAVASATNGRLEP